MAIDPTQQGAPPAIAGPPPPLPMDPQGAPPGAPAPQTLDGPAQPAPQMGQSLDPGSLAQIAMQAIAQAAQMDEAQFEDAVNQARMQFKQHQMDAIGQTGPAIDAILAQLQSAPPQTLDGPAAPAPVAPDPSQDPNAAPGPYG